MNDRPLDCQGRELKIGQYVQMIDFRHDTRMIELTWGGQPPTIYIGKRLQLTQVYVHAATSLWVCRFTCDGRSDACYWVATWFKHEVQGLKGLIQRYQDSRA